jgi:hypothetical protein
LTRLAVRKKVTTGGFIEIFDVRMVRTTPDLQIDTILDVYDLFRVRRIGVEEIMFKNLYASVMVAAARKRKLYPSVITFPQPKTNKISRILGLQPMIHDFKTLRFAKHLYKTVPEYFAQFDEFPMTHDDGPDATEMLVRMLEKQKLNAIPIGVGGTSYWRRSA